ncbi:MAG: ester cyclase [Gemmatimonadales bacterium]
MRAITDFVTEPIDYKALITRWITDVWNVRREETIDEMLAPDCVIEVEGSDTSLTVESFKQYRRAFLNAVPDLWVEILALTTEGASSVLEWRVRGTHLGPGLGIPPSGRRVDFTGFSSYHFSGTTIVHGADRWNRGEMIASLLQVRMDELKRRSFDQPRSAGGPADGGAVPAYRDRGAAADQPEHRPPPLRAGPPEARDRPARGGRQGARQDPGSVLARHGEDLASFA